jgi:acetoacetyl-CoA synthetase
LPLFPPPRFFPLEELNVAEHILRNGMNDAIAINFVREGAVSIEKVSWRALRARTGALRNALLSRGVQKGDVVAAVISNSVDAMVICLAALSLGAIWTSASCELGVESIIERFSQVQPKVVFADDGYIYGGKLINLEEKIREWSCSLGESVSCLKSVVVLPYCGLSVDIEQVYHGQSMKEFLHTGSGRPLEFNNVPFNHPAFILYSSGTVRHKHYSHI